MRYVLLLALLAWSVNASAAVKAVTKAAATAPLSAVLTWTPSTTRTDGSTITGQVTFTVYQGPTGAEVQLVNFILGSTLTATSGLAPGATVCWQVTETETATGLESARTPEACKTFPAAVTAPNAPAPVTVQ
jgi:hypothetical protein